MERRGFREDGEPHPLQPGAEEEFAAGLREISQQLSHNARHAGESRDNEMRVRFAGDLAVFFGVDEADQTVEIGDIRLRQA